MIAKKDFAWAHGGSDVRQYVKGQRIDSDDIDLIRVALDEGWADPTDWEDPVPVREPTKEELLDMRDALARRERELHELAGRLGEQAGANQVESARLEQLAAGHAVEAERLTVLAAQLAADRVAFDVVKAAAPAPTTGKGKDKGAA